MSDDIYDDAFVEVMGRRVDDTDWTVLDIYLVGEAVLNTINIVHTLGHTSPASTLEYTAGATPHTAIVRDFVAWTSGRKQLAPDCEENLRTLNQDSGWHRRGADRIGSQMAGESA